MNTTQGIHAGIVEAARAGFNHSTPLNITIAVFLGLALLLHRMFSVHLDPREPPMLKPRVPVIGHLVGLLWNRIDYFTSL